MTQQNGYCDPHAVLADLGIQEVSEDDPAERVLRRRLARAMTMLYHTVSEDDPAKGVLRLHDRLMLVKELAG